MKDKMFNVGLALIGIVWVTAYGKYQYYRGKVDANNANRFVIDVQQMVIETLNERLDDQQEKAR